MLVDMGEELGLSFQPREAEVGRQGIQGPNHVGVLEIPVIFVGHPFSVGEDGAHRGALAEDGAFVAADGLHADNILGTELERCERSKTNRYPGAVHLDKFVLLLGTGFLVEVIAQLVRDK